LTATASEKERTSGDVGIHVGGAIKGIEHSNVLGADVSKDILVLALSAGHPATASHVKNMVRQAKTEPAIEHKPVGILVENRLVLLLGSNDTDLHA
jgi:hypothetical protein